jgi:hypothetical protein
VAVVFLLSGAASLFALAPMRERAAHTGFSVTACRGIGALQIAGAAGLLLGLTVPVLGALTGAGLLLLLAGAPGRPAIAGKFRLLPGETGDDFHSLDRLYALIAPWTRDIPAGDLEIVRGSRSSDRSHRPVHSATVTALSAGSIHTRRRRSTSNPAA